MDDKKFESIFLEEWSSDKFIINDDEKAIGDILFSLKHLVSKELDEARNKELIGSSLDATLQLNVDRETYNTLIKYEDELKFIFITSECKLKVHDAKDQIKVLVEKNNNQKCDRCWHKHESVGKIKEHEKICSRCYSYIYEDGEKRYLG